MIESETAGVECGLWKSAADPAGDCDTKVMRPVRRLIDHVEIGGGPCGGLRHYLLKRRAGSMENVEIGGGPCGGLRLVEANLPDGVNDRCGNRRRTLRGIATSRHCSAPRSAPSWWKSAADPAGDCDTELIALGVQVGGLWKSAADPAGDCDTNCKTLANPSGLAWKSAADPAGDCDMCEQGTYRRVLRSVEIGGGPCGGLRQSES